MANLGDTYVIRPYFAPAVATVNNASDLLAQLATAAVTNTSLPTSVSVCFPSTRFAVIPSTCTTLFGAAAGADTVRAANSAASPYIGMTGPIEFSGDGLRRWSSYGMFRLDNCTDTLQATSFGCAVRWVGALNRSGVSPGSVWTVSPVLESTLFPATASAAFNYSVSSSLRTLWPWSTMPTARAFTLGVFLREAGMVESRALMLSIAEQNALNSLGSGDFWDWVSIVGGCSSATAAAVIPAFLASAPNLTAVLSCSCSAVDLVGAPLVAPIKIPWLSASSTSTYLSSAATYPWYLRMVASDVFQVNTLAAVFAKFGWQRFAVFTSADSYGTPISSLIDRWVQVRTFACRFFCCCCGACCLTLDCVPVS
jgi:hypothetical protein